MPAASGAAMGAGGACGCAAAASGAGGVRAGMASPVMAGARVGDGGTPRGVLAGGARKAVRLASLSRTRAAAKASRVAISGVSGRGGMVPKLG